MSIYELLSVYKLIELLEWEEIRLCILGVIVEDFFIFGLLQGFLGLIIRWFWALESIFETLGGIDESVDVKDEKKKYNQIRSCCSWIFRYFIEGLRGSRSLELWEVSVLVLLNVW